MQANYTFFFTEASPFSQWYRCTFVLGGVQFMCAEQCMMYGKAQLFGDPEIAQKILAADHPKTHKALGRRVRGFAEPIWNAKRIEIVKAASLAKFGQNPELEALLLQTAPTELVEASPYDKIWGIGLAADDPRALDPATWRGQNLLGKVLTEVRGEL
ncbi:NADAR domain-containing protein [soil metagenome]